jgi:polyisoprenoid-binding protein YceI
MTTATPDIRFGRSGALPVTAGSWRVDSSRSSASFTARLAGRSVRGRLPLSGGAYVSASIEDSAAHLYAATGALRTGSAVLDRLLAGPGFLDAEAHPDISFRSEMLACVPTGWRAVGHLRVKGTEHPLVCELDADLRDQQQGPAAMTINTRWVIDSTWITTQRVPMLARRIAMSCSLALEQTDELDVGGLAPAA